MKPEIWFGSHQSLDVFNQYELKYSMDKEAYSRYPEHDGGVDQDFGVDSERKGLTVMEMVNGMPVIKVHGSLVPKFSRYHAWFGGSVTSYEAIKDAMLIATEAGHTDVLMDFSSGGGAVSGIDSVTTLMSRLQTEGVNFHGHTDTMSFSASYWIMSQCDQITASKMAELGSIGTLAVVTTYANTEENLGVTFTMFKEGEFKAIGNPYEKLSEADKKYIQANLAESNAFFLNQVSAQRGLSLDDTDQWAEGKTFYAAKAVKNGLVDRVTTLDDLIGSGSTANNPGDRRKFEMKISPEKLAQIEAGADPKTVLTSAELKQYNADVAALNEASEKEAAEKEAADKITSEKLAAEEAAIKEAASKPGAGDPLHEALRANGKLESQVETLTEQLARAQADAAASKTVAEQLMVLGQATVDKLQAVTGSPRVAKATPSELLAEYNEQQAKMAKIFGKGGQHSESTKVDEPSTVTVAQDFRHKVAQLQPRKS